MLQTRFFLRLCVSFHFFTSLLFFFSFSSLDKVSGLDEKDINIKSFTKSADEKIKKFVILMLENRSFDHALGFLKQKNNEIDGCLQEDNQCYNQLDPNDSSSPKYFVNDNGGNVVADPHHSIKETTLQIFGSYAPVPEESPERMNGFVSSYTTVVPDAPEQIMECFSPDHLPILSELAMEYALFDNWFASVPGPTMVNRAYAFSSTSHGMGKNDKKTMIKGLPQKTMFQQALEMGLDYRIYFTDGPTPLEMKDMRSLESLKRYHYIEKFHSDVANGDLPEISWIDPAYFNGPGKHKATDQHPDHDVSLGEKVIKEIYESLRQSSLWNETALIITYDEHGGFYDHVVPPCKHVPNPDGRNSTDDPFDFTRLGVRIPTVVVSPWVKRGSVYHATNPADSRGNDIEIPAGTGSYEHSSILSTILHKILKPKHGFPPPNYLTKRDYWAATFEHIFEKIDEPRSDCPRTLPEIWNGSTSILTLDGSRLISDLQLEIITVIAGTINDLRILNHIRSGRIAKFWLEADGLNYCKKAMQFLMDAAANEGLRIPSVADDFFFENQ